MKKGKELLSKGFQLLKMKNSKNLMDNVIRRTDVYPLDGSEQISWNDDLLPGKCRTRSCWSADAKILITKTDYTSPHMSGSLIMNRSCPDPNTMIITLQVIPDKAPPSSNVKRIFKRMNTNTDTNSSPRKSPDVNDK
jgi:hypothetical protein